MHIDVNNAFLSWTAVDLLKQGYKYDIRNSYAVIGGDPEKRTGIVLAKSIPAKKLGVVTGETLYNAKKKCPSLKSYPANHKLYGIMSKSFIDLLKKYTPDIEQVSIDECFIDYGKVKNLYGEEMKFAHRVQKEIFDTLGFTVNVGIANNKLCAKMASDFSKPNKIHTCYDYEAKEKMWPLDVSELFGVGRKSSLKLKEIGINTIGDLANTEVTKLTKYFKNQSQYLIDIANGISTDEVDSSYSEPKGIGNEITLDHDVYNKDELEYYLLELSEQVAGRLRAQNKFASVIAVTIKDTFFKRKSHQKKLVNATDITNEIYELSKKILSEIDISDGVRLIGIRLDQLSNNLIHQVSLFEDIEDKTTNKELDKIVDTLKNKYGTKIINKASLAKKK